MDEITSSTLAAAIKAGDKKLEEMVALGGGLVESMPKLFRKEFEAGVRAHTNADVRDAVKMAVIQLQGHSASTGAASSPRGSRLPLRAAARKV